MINLEKYIDHTLLMKLKNYAKKLLIINSFQYALIVATSHLQNKS